MGYVIETIKSLKGYFNDKKFHFLYKSKKHGHGYLNFDPVFPYVRTLHRICVDMVRPFEGEFDAVVGAATGGIPLVYITALLYDVEIACWADKEGDKFVWRQGFAPCLKGRRVLIVEDIANQGTTIRALVALVEDAGGEVVGVACAVNRGGLGERSLGVSKFVALDEVSMSAVEAEDCEGCRKGVPMAIDIGHGDKFHEENPDFPTVRLLDA